MKSTTVSRCAVARQIGQTLLPLRRIISRGLPRVDMRRGSWRYQGVSRQSGEGENECARKGHGLRDVAGLIGARRFIHRVRMQTTWWLREACACCAKIAFRARGAICNRRCVAGMSPGLCHPRADRHIGPSERTTSLVRSSLHTAPSVFLGCRVSANRASTQAPVPTGGS